MTKVVQSKRPTRARKASQKVSAPSIKTLAQLEAVREHFSADFQLLITATVILGLEEQDLEKRVVQLAKEPCQKYGLADGGMLRATVEELHNFKEKCSEMQNVAELAGLRMVAVAARWSGVI
jgi:hypothetical protein